MMMYKKLLSKLIVLNLLCYISTFTVVPSDTIDVIEGGEYTFGIEDDNITCICEYKSNLDSTSTSFKVRKIVGNNNCDEKKPEETISTVTFLNKIQRASDRNIVRDLGNILSCQVNVKNVDDQGPTKWSLIPHVGTGTFPKQTLDFKINFFYAVPLVTKVINIFEGEDFYQYLNISLKFEDCHINYNGNTQSLNLESEETKVLETNNKIDRHISERISSLGRDLCGFKLKNVVQTDTITWTLTGITSDKKKYRTTFKPVIFKKIPDSSLHKEQVVEVGKSVYMTCAEDQSETHFCKLYNPKGALVYTQDKITGARRCTYSISSFQVDHYGVWKCISGNTKTLKSIEYTFKFEEKELPFMSTWVKQKGNYLSIGCQLQKAENAYFDYCKLTSPDQQVFSLQPGSSTDRYIALGTDFKNLKCGMEIKLPLRHNENGMWRCETNAAGAFINVGKEAIVDYQKYSKLTTRIGEKILILCEVPFYSSFCHIKAPNGTRYAVEDKYASWLGRCSFEIKNVNVTDNGTWTCSYAQKNGISDEEVLVEVTIADVLSYNPEVKVTEDYSFNMLCNSGGLPLKYCQFINPDGKSYYIDNKVNSTYLSYYGRGLEYGECGIKISNAANSDSGTWSCAVQIHNDRREISARISVEVSPNLLSGSNFALTLGVTIGVAVIASLFALIAIRTIRKRRQARLEITPIQRLGSSHDGSQEDVFNLNIAGQSYSNPQIVRDDDHPHQY